MSIEKYVIITPVRDEETYIEKTIKSVVSQTKKPVEWIIVNDGSTDSTAKIIDNYSELYTWIKTIHRKDRGFRQPGSGVIEAFYEGYNALGYKNWEFVVKLDGDLAFGCDYFSRCFDNFERNANLGIGGGDVYYVVRGRLKLEKNPTFHVRGATKIYKRRCWEALGGLVKVPGWDTIDEVKANMLGWETKSFSDTKVTQLKKTGAAEGALRDKIKGGIASYVAGYHPLFMLVKCIKITIQKPYLIGAMGCLYGFVSSYLRKRPQVDDRMLIKYLRDQQLRRLAFRKSIWR